MLGSALHFGLVYTVTHFQAKPINTMISFRCLYGLLYFIMFELEDLLVIVLVVQLRLCAAISYALIERGQIIHDMVTMEENESIGPVYRLIRQRIS